MNKTKPTILFALIALVFSVQTLLRAADRMRPGLWENTVTSDGKSFSRTSCITAEVAATANQSAQAVRESIEKSMASTAKGTCKITVNDFTAADTTVTTRVDCGTISSINVTTYKGDTIETLITSVNAGVTKKTVNAGRRIGACP